MIALASSPPGIGTVSNGLSARVSTSATSVWKSARPRSASKSGSLSSLGSTLQSLTTAAWAPTLVLAGGDNFEGIAYNDKSTRL
jgi:hypothetical protein